MNISSDPLGLVIGFLDFVDISALSTTCREYKDTLYTQVTRSLFCKVSELSYTNARNRYVAYLFDITPDTSHGWLENRLFLMMNISVLNEETFPYARYCQEIGVFNHGKMCHWLLERMLEFSVIFNNSHSNVQYYAILKILCSAFQEHFPDRDVEREIANREPSQRIQHLYCKLVNRKFGQLGSRPKLTKAQKHRRRYKRK